MRITPAVAVVTTANGSVLVPVPVTADCETGVEGVGSDVAEELAELV